MAENAVINLIASLKTTLEELRSDKTLHDTLHNPDSLPDKKIYTLASEALDLLSEVRLELEPSQLILADHFLGMEMILPFCTLRRCTDCIPRVYEHQSTLHGCRIQDSRSP
jgi:hypothetical protein